MDPQARLPQDPSTFSSFSLPSLQSRHMITEFLDLFSQKRFSRQQRTWPECVGVAEWQPGVRNLELADRLVRSSERERGFSSHFAGAQFVSTYFIFFVLIMSASALSPSRIFNKHPQQRLKTGCKITFCNKTNHPTTQEKD